MACAAQAEEPPPTDAALHESAAGIVALYVADGAERQTNLPSGVQRAIEGAVGAAGKEGGSRLAADVFDAAVDEIFTLMWKDTLPRFREAASFGALMSAIGEAEPWPATASAYDVPQALRRWQAAHEDEARVSDVSNSTIALDGPLSPKGAEATEAEGAAAEGEYAENY